MQGRSIGWIAVIILLMVTASLSHQLQEERAAVERETSLRMDLEDEIIVLDLQVASLEADLNLAYTDLYGRWEEFLQDAPSWVVREFRVTGYAPFDDPVGLCSDGNPESTATGTYPTEGRTIAVDPRVIPYGTPVWIEGIGWRIAEDTGGLIRGDRIDVMYESRAEALRVNRTVLAVFPEKEEER